MNYTRRKLLRDAANVSLAATASSAFPVLSYAATRPLSFGLGVRIFFIGTWLFCKDPVLGQTGKEQLLAITFDDGMGHTFPYGPWKDSKFDQQNAPGLPGNPTAVGQRNAYAVNVSGYQTQLTSVQNVFTDAGKNCKFVFATIPQSNFPPNFSAGDIRVISIPLPTKLYTGIFSGGQISSSSFPVSGNTAASAHVFEYLGGTLTYNDNSINVTLPPSTDYNGDFHFHTVPPPCTRHGAQMFKDLINSVFPNAANVLALKEACDDSNPDPGQCLPTSVTNGELDILPLTCSPQTPPPGCTARPKKQNQKGKENMVNRTTASCAGAGIGVVGG